MFTEEQMYELVEAIAFHSEPESLEVFYTAAYRNAYDDRISLKVIKTAFRALGPEHQLDICYAYSPTRRKGGTDSRKASLRVTSRTLPRAPQAPPSSDLGVSRSPSRSRESTIGPLVPYLATPVFFPPSLP
ncbi:hypothetical protein FRB95_004728 [Tulasnella sp. JGI-2019a]|nr:hypothetical protein FRB95_004728 [Tulasnella sp. JGI-2019a]